MLGPNDVKEKISYIHLDTLVTSLGYSLDRPRIDRDSVDATISAKGIIPGSNGYIRSPKIDVQLKSTGQVYFENSVTFKLPKKNYDDLRQNTMVPRILIILVIPEENGWFAWDLEKVLLYGKGYWKTLKGMEEIKNSTSRTVCFDQSDRLNVEVIKRLMIAAANREEFSYVSC